MTSASSMHAMILSAPPQARQVSMSMPNTRLSRCAQLIDARRSTGVCSCESPVEGRFVPLPRFAGVTRARCLLLGAENGSDSLWASAPRRRAGR